MTDEQAPVSRAQRDAAEQLLRRQYVDGRLDHVESEARIARVRAARTRADLLPLFADLPVDVPVAEPIGQPITEFPPYRPAPPAGTTTSPAVDTVATGPVLAPQGRRAAEDATDRARKWWVAIACIVVVGGMVAGQLFRPGGGSGWPVIVIVVVALLVRSLVKTHRRSSRD